MNEKVALFELWTEKLMNHLAVSIDFLCDHTVLQGEQTYVFHS